MKSLIALFLLLTASIFPGREHSRPGRSIALPNPNLINCNSPQLWQHETIQTEAVYPAQVTMDHFDKHGCPKGLVAMYDKAVPEGEIGSAINLHYGKWAKAIGTGPVRIWRVEDEKFAIQLATIHDSPEEGGASDTDGMKHVIYISFSIGK